MSKEPQFIEILLFAVILILCLLFILGVLRKKAHNKDLNEKNMLKSLIEAQKNEIEKQNMMIGNLGKLYNEVVEYDKQRTEFFSNMIHELKTPLSVILGATQLIEKKREPPRVEDNYSGKHFHTIKQNCYRLIRLVNNILDITKIDSGYLKANLTNCNLVYLIEEITRSVAPYAEQKRLSLRFNTHVKEVIMAVDIEKMERIMLNLLSNAIKFTAPEGRITVTLKKEGKMIAISVKDTGSGIPKDKQQDIFMRYHQVGSSLIKEVEGSGIGLSLVKSFVGLHNGSIKVISEPGRGSEFIVEMPIRLYDSNEKENASTNMMQDRMIEKIKIEFSDIYALSTDNKCPAVSDRFPQNAVK